MATRREKDLSSSELSEKKAQSTRK